MDALGMFALSGIMSGQSRNNHEIEELHHTLKQIASANGIKIETIEETRKREQYEHKLQSAMELGVSVEEYECMVDTTATENFFRLIASCIVGFLIGGVVGNFAMELSVGASWVLGIISCILYSSISYAFSSKRIDVGITILFVAFMVLVMSGLLG